MKLWYIRVVVDQDWSCHIVAIMYSEAPAEMFVFIYAEHVGGETTYITILHIGYTYIIEMLTYTYMSNLSTFLKSTTWTADIMNTYVDLQ